MNRGSVVISGEINRSADQRSRFPLERVFLPIRDQVRESEKQVKYVALSVEVLDASDCWRN